MVEWAMSHPWLTFFIVCVALVALCDIVESICKMVTTIVSTRRYEPLERGGSKEGDVVYADEDSR